MNEYPRDPASGGQIWQCWLVELHVLAASGDDTARAAAAAWMAGDPAAQRMWDQIEHDCALVWAAAGSPSAHG